MADTSGNGYNQISEKNNDFDKINKINIEELLCNENKREEGIRWKRYLNVRFFLKG